VHGYALPGTLPGIPKKGRFDASSVTTGAWAAGAIVSTTRDVATFYSALLGGRVLAPPLLKEMRRTVPAYHPYYPTEHAGLGIMRFDIQCPHGQRPAWGHLGGNVAYSDVVLANPDGTRVVVLMVNVGNAGQSYLSIAEAAFCGP
jgi:D-alanyl-D-alanine carboxypeptidase